MYVCMYVLFYHAVCYLHILPVLPEETRLAGLMITPLDREWKPQNSAKTVEGKGRRRRHRTIEPEGGSGASCGQPPCQWAPHALAKSKLPGMPTTRATRLCHFWRT